MAEQLDFSTLPITCGGCAKEFRAGEPIFHFDGFRYHVGCVPAEHSSQAQALLGVKSC
jgi:hypothetical protein